MRGRLQDLDASRSVADSKRICAMDYVYDELNYSRPDRLIAEDFAGIASTHRG